MTSVPRSRRMCDELLPEDRDERVPERASPHHAARSPVRRARAALPLGERDEHVLERRRDVAHVDAREARARAWRSTSSSSSGRPRRRRACTAWPKIVAPRHERLRLQPGERARAVRGVSISTRRASGPIHRRQRFSASGVPVTIIFDR